MKDQGGGTLFSPSIESRTKLSIKVTTAESNENRRRLTGGGGGSSSGYSSYVGPKSMLTGSIMPPPAEIRLRAGNSSATLGGSMQPHRQDLFPSMEKVKEFRGGPEPLLKRSKVAPSPPPPPPPHLSEEAGSSSGLLPQWGMGKRPRRSRFETSKHVSTARVQESGNKPLVRAEKQSCGEDLSARLWPAKPASVDANGYGTRGSTIGRNGMSCRAAVVNDRANNVNGHSACSPARHGSMGADKDRERAPPHKSELRQRSESSAERSTPSAVNSGVAAAHGHRASTIAETGAVASSAFQKPRLDLQTLEWPRILISLSRKEKEDDFLILKGTKLPQRPKKRPKVVERALHYCTPGNTLCDLVRGRYDVREKKSTKKRPRGLKAMESMESESE